MASEVLARRVVSVRRSLFALSCPIILISSHDSSPSGPWSAMTTGLVHHG